MKFSKPEIRTPPEVIPAGTLAFLIGICLAVGPNLQAQSLPNDLVLPNTTTTSGNVLYAASNSITAPNGFVVSDAASVTFQPGNTITLSPGFRATAGSASTTFRATIGPITGPIITTTALPPGTVSAPYSQALSAAGGTAPYNTWTATGSLPAGLALNPSTGTISGTPTTVTGSPFSFSVTVRDNASAISPGQSLSIAISAGCGNVPTHEYIRLGGRIISVENTCTAQ